MLDNSHQDEWGAAMANAEHVKVVKAGTTAIDDYLVKNAHVRFDLSKADFTLAHLTDAHLRFANFSGANLFAASLNGAHLEGANFTGSHINSADLFFAILSGANLTGANLFATNLNYAYLKGTNLTDALVGATTFASVDLSGTIGLDKCDHKMPSSVGIDTILMSSGKIPDEFLRGCGVNPLIQKLLVGNPQIKTDAFYALLGESGLPLKMESCFISYSTKDKPFVDRLEAKLNERGVEYWYAPKHGEWGRGLREQIDRQISVKDRVILVCSKASLADSDFVQWEIERAIEQEKKQNRTILFPVMIDGALLEWKHPRATRILDVLAGDFRGATKGKAFNEAFEKLVRGLFPRK